MITLFQREILIIAVITGLAATLPGVFLVLRGVALMSDAISHAILLGIAIMFLFVQRLGSIWLLLGAGCAGMLTVLCTELLITTQRLKKDAAIGLVFPLFFSIGIIIITQWARNVHLDSDMVLLGELAFAPFNRWTWGAWDMGPLALWTIGIILFINTVFIALFYKELVVTTFDKDFAHITGISPYIVHYALMGITSITAVGAFDVVGSIVVVALMITPPATAYLLTNRLSTMITLSMALSIGACVCGYFIAHFYDISIAGALASTSGLFFIIVLLLSKEKGIFAQWLAHRHHRCITLQKMILLYVGQQPNSTTSTHDIMKNLQISPMLLAKILNKGITQQLFIHDGDYIKLNQ